MKHKMPVVVRLLLTMLLLQQVWFNSHWSVALSLTLIFIGIEYTALREG